MPSPHLPLSPLLSFLSSSGLAAHTRFKHPESVPPRPEPNSNAKGDSEKKKKKKKYDASAPRVKCEHCDACVPEAGMQAHIARAHTDRPTMSVPRVHITAEFMSVRKDKTVAAAAKLAAASAAASAAAAADDPGEDTPKKKKEKARREEKRRREEEDMKRKLKKIENSAEEKSKEANVALRSAAGLFTDVSNPSSCISGRLLIFPPLLIRSCPPPCLR